MNGSNLIDEPLKHQAFFSIKWVRRRNVFFFSLIHDVFLLIVSCMNPSMRECFSGFPALQESFIWTIFSVCFAVVIWMVPHCFFLCNGCKGDFFQILTAQSVYRTCYLVSPPQQALISLCKVQFRCPKINYTQDIKVY